MTEKPKKGSGTAAIIFAVFAAACLIAFLAFRGSDIGQLPKLVGNLDGWPLVGSDGIGHLFNSLRALAIGMAWYTLGSLVLSLMRRRIGPDFSLPLQVIVSFAVGAAVWSLVWFFLGVAGLYSTTTAIIAILVWFALTYLVVMELKGEDDEDNDEKNKLISLFTEKKPKQADSDSQKSSAFEKVLLGLIYIQVALSFIASLAPPTAKDTLLYHFALPKAFVAQGSNAFIDGNIASHLPLGTEMQVVWARLMSHPYADDAASGATIWLFFPLLLIAVYAWAVEIGISRTWSLIATAMVASIPTAYYVASSGYIDLSLALYVTLATFALTRWWKEQSWGWVVLMAIFLGAALSVKLTAVFVFAAFALIVLLRARETKNPVATAPGSDNGAVPASGRIVLTGFAALLLAGVIASPWYIRTWVATGSPVFPFYMSIWPGKANGWDVERSYLFQAMNSQYGGTGTDKVNYLTAPVRLSVAAQPEQHEYYDGVLGPAFLIGLPLLAWALWKFDLPIEVKIGAGVAGVMYLFWLFSSEQLRYLLPIVPLLAIAIVASAEKIGGAVAKVALRFAGYGFCLRATHDLRVVLNISPASRRARRRNA